MLKMVNLTKISLETVNAQNHLLKTSTWNYSEQLQDFISRYKTRPPDIKFWPYGPYWPKSYEEEVQETPRHIKCSPKSIEPLVKRMHLVRSKKTHQLLFNLYFLSLYCIYQDVWNFKTGYLQQKIPTYCCWFIWSLHFWHCMMKEDINITNITFAMFFVWKHIYSKIWKYWEFWLF